MNFARLCSLTTITQKAPPAKLLIRPEEPHKPLRFLSLGSKRKLATNCHSWHFHQVTHFERSLQKIYNYKALLCNWIKNQTFPMRSDMTHTTKKKMAGASGKRPPARPQSSACITRGTSRTAHPPFKIAATRRPILTGGLGFRSAWASNWSAPGKNQSQFCYLCTQCAMPCSVNKHPNKRTAAKMR